MSHLVLSCDKRLTPPHTEESEGTTAGGEAPVTSLGTQVPPCPLQGCPRGASAPWAGGDIDIHQGETAGEALPSTSDWVGVAHYGMQGNSILGLHKFIGCYGEEPKAAKGKDHGGLGNDECGKKDKRGQCTSTAARQYACLAMPCISLLPSVLSAH